jgi:hypothetical protein
MTKFELNMIVVQNSHPRILHLIRLIENGEPFDEGIRRVPFTGIARSDLFSTACNSFPSNLVLRHFLGSSEWLDAKTCAGFSPATSTKWRSRFASIPAFAPK